MTVGGGLDRGATGVLSREYETMYRVEDGMWWYVGMRAITRAVLERRSMMPGRVLDAGCGTGAAVEGLGAYGRVTAVDLSHYALTAAGRRGHARLACASVTALPFASETFALVTSFDVLPMLGPGADRDGIAEMTRVLVPGGRLLVRAAACDWLRGAHDECWAVQHRYRRRELRAALTGAGLDVELLSYCNTWLFPLAAVKRLSEPLFPRQQQSDLAFQFGPFNRVFAALLASEAPLVVRGWLPIGLSLVAVARKA